MRLDKFLCDNRYFESRQKAIDCIKNGFLSVNGKIVTKPAFDVSDQDQVEVLDRMKYVSRAGEKLDFAITAYQIDLKDKVVLDIGASTGGFTDCCLQHEAKKVYAIDVGTNQLADRLRKDKRVIVRENTNARYLSKKDFDDEIDFICMDVSFISCTLILPVISSLLNSGKESVILVKPQFEVGSGYLDKHGVVKDEKRVKQILYDINSLLNEIQLVKLRCEQSPITGRNGNREYLLYIKKI